MVRSITKDPFRAIGFLAQEMGAITPQNQLFNEEKKRLVERYINHYVEGYDLVGTAAMRSTHVEINGEKLYGLTFVTGVVPKRDTLQESITRLGYYQSPSIIYIPTPIYKYGEFIILEDVFANLFSNIHTLFDEDLKLEKPDALRPDQDGHIIVKDDEERIMMIQYYDLQALVHLFEQLLSVTHYGSLEWRADYRLRIFLPFKGVPNMDFPGNMSTHRATKPFCRIHFPKLIMLASARKLLKLIYPGSIDGDDTFDTKITSRFFAQYIYLDNRMNHGRSRVDDTKFIDAIEEIIQESVDRHLEIIKKIESPEFLNASLEDKYLLLDTIYKYMLQQLQIGKEKDNGNRKNQKTEIGNIDGIETAIDE